jgi:hypothetical protein
MGALDDLYSSFGPDDSDTNDDLRKRLGLAPSQAAQSLRAQVPQVDPQQTPMGMPAVAQQIMSKAGQPDFSVKNYDLTSKTGQAMMMNDHMQNMSTRAQQPAPPTPNWVTDTIKQGPAMNPYQATIDQMMPDFQKAVNTVQKGAQHTPAQMIAGAAGALLAHRHGLISGALAGGMNYASKGGDRDLAKAKNYLTANKDYIEALGNASGKFDEAGRRKIEDAVDVQRLDREYRDSQSRMDDMIIKAQQTGFNNDSLKALRDQEERTSASQERLNNAMYPDKVAKEAADAKKAKFGASDPVLAADLAAKQKAGEPAGSKLSYKDALEHYQGTRRENQGAIEKRHKELAGIVNQEAETDKDVAKYQASLAALHYDRRRKSTPQQAAILPLLNNALKRKESFAPQKRTLTDEIAGRYIHEEKLKGMQPIEGQPHYEPTPEWSPGTPGQTEPQGQFAAGTQARAVPKGMVGAPNAQAEADKVVAKAGTVTPPPAKGQYNDTWFKDITARMRNPQTRQSAAVEYEKYLEKTGQHKKPASSANEPVQEAGFGG